MPLVVAYRPFGAAGHCIELTPGEHVVGPTEAGTL
jgi:hypothetical protein